MAQGRLQDELEAVQLCNRLTVQRHTCSKSRPQVLLTVQSVMRLFQVRHSPRLLGASPTTVHEQAGSLAYTGSHAG
jgi:hypothetical protein